MACTAEEAVGLIGARPRLNRFGSHPALVTHADSWHGTQVIFSVHKF